ncbi:hypothetical protein CROQUDRAFT_45135 [Cronartium quercuum f. sp. fusiforme G11]|uniref:SET domain-containing protein n=1 Tax=Cronartium quercuum f. sp. fusiforme G11 TaxID=708437 RepID=A0A9P6TBN7_9BASI|nr:hypothetical protein CROQUDRAFT_45135 [Cronartium quercuum f. sp. fusiforme G11]
MNSNPSDKIKIVQFKQHEIEQETLKQFLNYSHLLISPSKIFKPNKFVELCLDLQNPKKGRGVYSKHSKTIKPGTTVLSLAPHVAVLDTSSLSTRCSSCFLEDEDFEALPDPNMTRQIRRCTKCRIVSYCSENCQRLDWASHKPECLALTNYAKLVESVIKANQKSKSRGTGGGMDVLDFEDDGEAGHELSKVPSAPVRALGRLIWKKDRESEKDPNWWTGMEELSHHLNAEPTYAKDRLMQLSVNLSRYVGSQSLQKVLGSASTLLPFCCRFLENSFCLTSVTLDNIGVILCPTTSFINHSCVPNVVVVFPEGGEGASKKSGGKEWVKVIAIKKIEPGEEIVTSYVDLAGTRKERRNDLLQRYQFVCDCALCTASDPNEVDPREALKCPKCTNWFSLMHAIPVSPISPVASGPMITGSGRRLDAGPSSVGGSQKKEISCPNCGFSRLIDVEGQRLAIKKSGQALNAQKEPAKAAYYAEKAIEWFQIKLSPFTFGPAFYPILDLRRMKMVSHLLCKTDQNLKQATAETEAIISGVHLLYGIGHPVSIITKSTITKLCDHTWRSTVNVRGSIFDLRNIANNNLEQIELGLNMLESLRQYQCLAVEECLVGFGSANGGGRLGRSIEWSIGATEVEIEARRRILGERRRGGGR